jgi:hypothetical protein
MSETAKCARCGETETHPVHDSGPGWFQDRGLGRALHVFVVPLPEEDAAIRPFCQADGDDHCMWIDCPQLRDNEPETTGRHCPLDICACGERGRHEWTLECDKQVPAAPPQEDCACDVFSVFGFCVHTSRSLSSEEAKQFEAINRERRTKVARATGEGEAPTPVMLDDLTRRINELHAFLSSDNASGDFGRALEGRVALAHRILCDFAALRTAFSSLREDRDRLAQRLAGTLNYVQVGELKRMPVCLTTWPKRNPLWACQHQDYEPTQCAMGCHASFRVPVPEDAR